MIAYHIISYDPLMKASLLTYLISVVFAWWYTFEPNDMLEIPPFCSVIIFFQYAKSRLSSYISNKMLSMGLMYITSSMIYQRNFWQFRSYTSWFTSESNMEDTTGHVSRKRSERLVLSMFDWRLLLLYLSDSK